MFRPGTLNVKNNPVASPLATKHQPAPKTMTLPHKLSAEDRKLIRDIIAGLGGYEKQKEAARVRSIVCRMDDAYRLADNARQAALERRKYGDNLEEGRRKATAKAQRRRDRMRSTAIPCDSGASACLPRRD